MKLLSKVLYLNLFLFVFISCDKEDDVSLNEVSGIYEGTITSELANKSDEKSTSINENKAIAEITMVGDQIQVYCHSENFETTLMLDLFKDNDNFQVCLTGNDFEKMYQHMYNFGGMHGGEMMNSANQWMNHLNNNHKQGDLHFGGFDMKHNTFEYTFNINGLNYHFQGAKQ